MKFSGIYSDVFTYEPLHMYIYRYIDPRNSNSLVVSCVICPFVKVRSFTESYNGGKLRVYIKWKWQVSKLSKIHFTAIGLVWDFRLLQQYNTHTHTHTHIYIYRYCYIGMWRLGSKDGGAIVPKRQKIWIRTQEVFTKLWSLSPKLHVVTL